MSFSYATSAANPPQAVIENAFATLAQGIVRGELHASMPQDQLRAFVERELGPSIDVKRFARGVMGKYARTAQLATFSASLKALLLKTYSKGLGSVERFERVEILKSNLSPDGERATVATRLLLSGGEAYQVSYQMHRDTRGWRISNLIAEGINLGLVYRQQFANLYNAQGRDLSATLGQWAVQLR